MQRPAGHVARNIKVTCIWRDLGERDHLEDLVVDGRAILKRTFKKLDGRRALDSYGSV